MRVSTAKNEASQHVAMGKLNDTAKLTFIELQRTT